VSPRIEPGWFADPAGAAAQRWWDGSAWSERTRGEPAPPETSEPPVGVTELEAATASRAAVAAPTAMRPPLTDVPPPAAEEMRARGLRPVGYGAAVVLLLATGLTLGWLHLDDRAGTGAAEADEREEADESAATAARLEDELASRDEELRQHEAQIAARDEMIADLESELERVRGELDATPGRQQATGDGTEIVVGELRFSEIEVRPDGADDFQIQARMTNEWSRSIDGVTITATIFDEGGRILGVLTGYEPAIDAGRSSSVTLTGVDDYMPDWDSLEIQVEYE
jgi:hypothetical protein